MSIENMFGDLDNIDILAETKTGEVVMVLVCNGFIDGSPETQTALLDKMEGYLNHTQSEEFQKEYGDWSVILRVTLDIVKPLGWERTSTTLTDMDISLAPLFH